MDRPTDPEEDRKRQQQLAPGVLEQVRDVLLADDVHDHGGVEHRQRQQCSDADSDLEVLDLSAACLGLGVLGVGRSRLAADSRREACRLLHGGAQPLDVDEGRVVHDHGALGTDVHLRTVDAAGASGRCPSPLASLALYSPGVPGAATGTATCPEAHWVVTVPSASSTSAAVLSGSS